ncbi:hypothetical protein K402DRAFT_424227 [Aulographum hederae CBS 113979]|uniref:N-glycosylation protein-like protein n=1 Tax=Aulographum hederae CBS 113979 TaxID=1176131 RepID=A0A6G1GQ23_9PEZI|nr:hypothetical protein K402DRAFT_424227 [Aulographum hederae CBS 113979]
MPQPQPSKQHPEPSCTTPTPAPTTRKKSALHPRVAVLLGVPKAWHIPLILARLASVGPAVWWGSRCLYLVAEAVVFSPQTREWDLDGRLMVAEVALAAVWCGASAYLGYFFTDCVMSRWLLRYPPPSTLFRLLVLNLTNYAAITNLLSFTGAATDPFLLLPAWIAIAITLTLLYHLSSLSTGTNIRRETSAALRVFCLANFLTMCALLTVLHFSRRDRGLLADFSPDGITTSDKTTTASTY